MAEPAAAARDKPIPRCGIDVFEAVDDAGAPQRDRRAARIRTNDSDADGRAMRASSTSAKRQSLRVGVRWVDAIPYRLPGASRGARGGCGSVIGLKVLTSARLRPVATRGARGPARRAHRLHQGKKPGEAREHDEAIPPAGSAGGGAANACPDGQRRGDEQADAPPSAEDSVVIGREDRGEDDSHDIE